MNPREFHRLVELKLAEKGYFSMLPEERAQKTIEAFKNASGSSTINVEALKEALREQRGGDR